MTRILYWNIEKFALNKIADPDIKRKKSGSSFTKALASQQRLNYILRHVVLRQGFGIVAPDIFVLVEVQTAYDGKGRLVRGAGSNGALHLLQDIRNQTGNPNWMLVPPLQTGPNEAVAVYFDSTNLTFTGPWQWPGGDGPSFDPAALVLPPAVDYAPPYDVTLPVGQRRLAARVTGFTYQAGFVPLAHGPGADFLLSRSPYLATFAEVVGGRNLSIFAIHSPASFTAHDFLRSLAGIEQIVDNLGANEVRVVVGDFNVNLLDGIALNRRDAYQPLITAGYTLGIDRPANPLPPNLNGYTGYFATHILPVGTATYWSTLGHPEFYPGFGYIGSDRIQNFYAIDNIYTRYGGGAGGPMTNVTVLNGVAATPYRAFNPPVVPPEVDPPRGSYGFDSGMADVGRFVPAPNQAPKFSAGRQKAFQGWANFGYIRSTSDHLAIVADI